jgi:hypothetical protein
MKTTYIFLAVIAILVWNSFLIHRDKKLFNAYDKVCAELSQSHSNCRYSK